MFEGHPIDFGMSGGDCQIENDLNFAVVENLLDGADSRNRVFGGESLGSFRVEVGACDDLDLIEFTATL